MNLGRLSPTLTKLAAAALVASGLILGAGIGAADADEVLPQPDLLKVTAERGTPSVAGVEFFDKADNETNYEIRAREQRTDGKIVTVMRMGGAVAGNHTVATRQLDGLDPGARYCFTVQAFRIAGGDVDTSPRSNEKCLTMPRPLADRIGDAVLLPDVKVVERPDLVAVRVSGAPSLFDGATSVYEAVIRNDGAVKANAELAIVFGGSVEAWGMVETPAGFTCEARATITCQGSLGGSADPIGSRVAVIRFRAHADGKGLGSITATVDAAGAIAETNEANNTASLTVTVK